jgi:hypothetical protein
MIGATRVMRLAGAAESALLQGRPADAIAKLLQRLASALTTLREEAQPYLKNQPLSAAKPGDLVVNGPSIGTLAIDELCALLETQNLAAVDKFGELSGSLSGILQPRRFDRLREAIDCLDFTCAVELLREMRSVNNGAANLKIG